MNSLEFMQATGIKHAEYITRYIKRGIISPVKHGKSYEFTQSDVEAVLNYLEYLKSDKQPKSNSQQILVELGNIRNDISKICDKLDNFKL